MSQGSKMILWIFLIIFNGYSEDSEAEDIFAIGNVLNAFGFGITGDTEPVTSPPTTSETNHASNNPGTTITEVISTVVEDRLNEVIQCC